MKARPLILFAFVLSIAWLAFLLRAGGQPTLAQGAGSTERVSVASDGTEGNNSSNRPWISADGRYVAFDSGATNLVSGDTNNTQDIFVHDRQTGQTTRVSVASDGTQANSYSEKPAISADGRYVAFWSLAANLVSGDTNNADDIFVHDRQTGQTTRVSVASDGTQANSYSDDLSISGDGRYVTFESAASNLVSGDTNGFLDIFVHDRQTGQTTRVSVASDGTEGDNPSSRPAISGDGRFVTFESGATNLVSGDSNGVTDVFVHDWQTGQTTRVSVASDGTEGDSYSWSYSSAISADGRYVAFLSNAGNLVSGDTNNADDIFVHDRQTGQTTRVSVASDGTQGNSFFTSHSAISADGRYVTFESYASNLVSGDTNNTQDIFVHDQQTGQTSRVSVATDGTEGNSGSSWSIISGDGRYVAFESSATNLVSGDTNGFPDVFVHDRVIECYTLTTSVIPSGGGSVSASPQPNCAGGRYSQNTNVQLTAIENTGYAFSHWSGDASGSANPTTVTMNGDKNVTAIFTLVPFSCNNVTEIPQVECQALVALYNSTDGASWANNDAWLATNTPCSWYKVSCDVGHVDSLDLYTNNLNGTIPPEIGNLPDLFKLDLSENSLSGSIPSEIGNLQSLDILYLSYTQLSGAIPPELGNLALLRTLRLNDTQLSGPLPQSLTNLTNLDQFWFNNTNLCEPGDPDFQAWLAGISGLMSTGVICTEPTYTISGRVTDANNNPITDVTISSDAGHTTTTDGNGNYTLSGLAAGTYTVTPSKSGYTFSPSSHTVSVPPDATGVDFTGTPAGTTPIADFDASPLTGTAPLTVSMHNISTGDITSCNWNYGDGTTGTSCADYHDHTYSSAGDFTVSLTVTGPGGSDTQTRTNYIHVTEPTCYTLTTDVIPSDGGSVSPSPSPNCAGEKYSQNTNVQLTASPNTDYTFSHWSGDLSGSTNPTTVTMNGNKNVTANFNQKPPVVLLPGIMASKLRNDPNPEPSCSQRHSGEVWPNLPPKSLKWNEFLETLYLKDNGIQSEDDCDNISSTDIIDEIPVFADYYSSFINALISAGYTVVPYPYDWRLDLRDLANDLDSYLDENYPDQKVVLIGHSLGGLLAREYIRTQSADQVETVITVGSPYLGAPKAAYTMRSGNLMIPLLDPVASNDVISKIARNSPGANQLLPSRGYFKQEWYSPDKRGGYFINNIATLETYTETRQFFGENGQNGALMDEAQQFHDNIDEKFDHITVPYYILTANHYQTPVVVKEYKNGRFGSPVSTDWRITVYADGDGTVPWISASLQGADGDWSGNAIVYKCSTLNYEHEELLRDTRIQNVVKAILAGDSPTSCLEIQNLSALAATSIDFQGLAVWGAQVTVTDSVGRFNGPTSDGFLVTDIPGSTYEIIGDGTFVTLTPTDTYIVSLDLSGNRPLEVHLTDFVIPTDAGSTISQKVMFNKVLSVEGGSAELIYDPAAPPDSYRLNIDLDNDGIPDEIRPPDAVLSGSQASDITPPISQISLSGTQDSLGFYTGPVVVSLSATDDSAGVLRIEYSLDGGMTGQIYAGPFTVTAEDVPLLYVQATDRAGNAEFPWVAAQLRPNNLYLSLILKNYSPGSQPPANNPPNALSNPSPLHNAANVGVTTNLAWTGGDPNDGDTVTYDVYLNANESNPNALICNDISATTCDPAGNLFYSTDYYWKVVATDNHNASSTSSIWHFRTAAAPPVCNTPGIPSLVSPGNSTTINDTTPTFDWNNASDADEYQLQVDNNANFSSPEINIATASSDYTPTSGLSDNTYSWRVRGHNTGNGCDVYGSWSSAWSVSIDTISPSPPTLVSPGNGSTTGDNTPTFDWTASSGATQYQLQVDNNANFSSPEIDTTTASSDYTPLSGLSDGTYSWRVRASDAVGNWSNWSSAWSVTIATAPPTVAFNATTYSINEGDGSAIIEVVLSSPSGQTVTVNYASSDGTAAAGSDYTAASGTLIFVPGQTSQAFSVSILEDAVDEPNEVINLTLSTPSNATLGTPASATLTIVDNDFVEVDEFMFSEGQITLQLLTGDQETIQLRGSSTVHVFIDESTGQATDTDNDGLDQVQTKMIHLELSGNSSLGPVTLRLNEAQPYTGEIEERVNNTPGVLDLPPFAPTGMADSFFDVWFEIEVGSPGQSQVLHTAEPVRMAAVISYKPPAPGETYQNPFTQPTELLDENGQPTGIFILEEVYTPIPPSAY